MAFYRSPSTDPAWNLALEEYFFEKLDRSRSYLIFWQNDNTVVIGKNQNTHREIQSQFVREKGIRVVRRLSGGGAVYHDLGNLNFTFITDAPEGKIDLGRFCAPVAEALRSLGVDVQVSGRNDITLEGKKISGNAQYIRFGRVMHHGTLMFDSDLEILGRALQGDREKMKSKGIASVSSRVTNLRPYLPEGITLADFESRLLEYLGRELELEPVILTPEDLEEILQLQRSRYDTWQWNYGYSPRGTWENSIRIPGCGRVHAALEVTEGEIRGLALTGDFFGNREIGALCAQLEGCPFRREAVQERLERLELEEYIHGITPKALAKLLTP